MSLISHRKNSRIVTAAELATLPEPQQRGPQHQPVPHHLLVAALRVEAMERGYEVRREQLALGMNGSALFGVMDLMPPGVVVAEERRSMDTNLPAGVVVSGDRGMSIGFRNSINSTLAIKMVAGTRVFVCDNLALSGDLIALQRRNTKGLDLEDALKAGFDKFLVHATTLDIHIARLQAAAISDMAAKAKAFEVFAARVVPVHLFDDVEANYFRPTDEMTDCQPRTEWGLHNAFTRALKQLGPTRAFASNVALGRMFGMTGNA